ncbi:hypothetical protein CSOJ01_00384 [Colletotrichum sojae]|uniref:Uncharacterized protein n=1 Tax=Colletotrichum sojae TaxID=2175907 RepID=A0A8H6JX70_9PEZI|nr:hypothetical protein CSOJ01_00384 [Colletotrichum sojae]
MKETTTPGFATDNMAKVTKSSKPASKHDPTETASGSTVGLTENILSDSTSEPAKEIQPGNDSENTIMKAIDVKITAELATEPMVENSKRILAESAREPRADVIESSTDTKPEDTTEPADAPTNDLIQKAVEEHAKSPVNGVEVKASEKSENDGQSETTVDCANEPATKTAAESMTDTATNSNAESTTQAVAPLFEGDEKEASHPENILLQLEVIKKRMPLTDEQLAIISAFGHAMQPATEETAAEAARRLDALIPPLDEEEEIGDWLYRTWDLMVDLAISPDSTRHIQERLMSRSPSQLRWALDKVGHADVPRHWDVTALKDRAVKIEVNRCPAGLLYNGPEIMCLQRWGFWIERFEELGNNGPYLGEEARKAALEAAESMRKLERRIGNTLSTQ